MQSNYECLTLGHLNIRSLLPKIDEVRDLMATSNFDIFAVCESWLNDTVLDSEIAIEGYQVYRKDRSNSIGGGICLYVKNECAFTVCHDLMFDDVEALWGVLNLDSKRLLISVIYRPPSRGSSYFDDIVDMLIEKASNKEIDMILLGDLNYDYVVNESLHTNPVHDIEALYEMSQLITEKTRVTQNTESTLDIILTTNPGLHKRSGVIKKTLSDHYMTFTELSLPKKTSQDLQNTVTFRNYGHFDESEFVNDIQSNDLLNGRHGEIKWEDWKNAFLSLSNKHAPIKTARLKVRSNPWMTSDIVKLMYKRDKFHELAVKRKDDSLMNEYRKLRYTVTDMIKDRKRAYFTDVSNSIRTNPRSFWTELYSQDQYQIYS